MRTCSKPRESDGAGELSDGTSGDETIATERETSPPLMPQPVPKMPVPRMPLPAQPAMTVPPQVRSLHARALCAASGYDTVCGVLCVVSTCACSDWCVKADSSHMFVTKVGGVAQTSGRYIDNQLHFCNQYML